MTSIVYAAPYTPPGSGGAPEWPGLRMWWHGWDGSVWNVSDRSEGHYIRAGARGLSMPPVQRFSSGSAAVAGSRWRGRRALEREVYWPFSIFSDGGSQAWIEHDRAFMRTMHPDFPGTWVVEQPSGERRSLTCRFVDDGDPSLTVDPTLVGWGRYDFYLVAESPFWRGDPIVRTWTAAEPVDFFGGTGGPPFFISASSTTGTAQVSNPGDEDAHPIWLLHGPLDEATVGVGDRLVEVPFPLAEDETLVIDTRPTAQTARVIGSPAADASAAALLAYVEASREASVSVTRDLGAGTKFAAVPPGASVTLSLSAVGLGSVQMLLEPLWWRAW